jgi:hypothetical protein
LRQDKLFAATSWRYAIEGERLGIGGRPLILGMANASNNKLIGRNGWLVRVRAACDAEPKEICSYHKGGS